MFKKLIVICVTLFSLTGCFFYEEYYYVEPQPPPEPTHQQKTEKSVTAYMTERFTGSPYKYLSLGFGEWEVVLHPEEEELKMLRMERAKITTNAKNYGRKTFDSLLAVNDTLVMKKEMELRWETDSGSAYLVHHIFSLKVNDFKYKCFEGVFYLNKAFKVTDVKLEMDIVLEELQYASFQHYLKQELLFCYNENYENSMKTEQFYSFFNQRLESGEVEKNDMMPVIITAVSQVRNNCAFDAGKMVKAQVSNYIQRYPFDYPDYDPVEFSTPQELIVATTDGKDSLVGYRVFHSFKTKDVNSPEPSVNCLYFELDTYFMVSTLR